MARGHQQIRVLRLRIGMAVVAAFQVLFAAVRYATGPGDQHLLLRFQIMAVALVCVAFTYSPWVERFVRQATLLGCTLLLTAASWLSAAQGMQMEYTLAPTIMFFAVAALAEGGVELVVFAVT